MKIKIEKNYMQIPTREDNPIKKLCLYEDGNLLYDTDVWVDTKDPEYIHYLDVKRFKGKTLDIKLEDNEDFVPKFTDTPDNTGLYSEKYRPRAHFSAARGWINDPNGLVKHDGVYHMFFQHNPLSNKWGNMQWGHAVSKDLIHWEEKDVAIFPNEHGTIFSGSAAVKDGKMYLYYTAAGERSILSKNKLFTQCIAVSADGGETFEEYEKNPVIDWIEAENRDPQVIYCEERGDYIMSLYLNNDRFVLFASDDLLNWKEIQRISIPGDDECPNIYPIWTAEGKKWVMTGAHDKYIVGDFKDGLFVPCQEVKALHYGRNSYAAQVFAMPKEEEKRRIRIAWNTFNVPGMYFQCAMCIPTDMSLTKINGEYYLCTYPVKEIEGIYGECKEYKNIELGELGRKITLDKEMSPGAHDIFAEFEGSGNAEISFFGMNVNVDLKNGTVSSEGCEMPAFAENGKISVRIITDVNGAEIFAGKGQAHMCIGKILDLGSDKLESTLEDGNVTVKMLRDVSLKNIWDPEGNV